MNLFKKFIVIALAAFTLNASAVGLAENTSKFVGNITTPSPKLQHFTVFDVKGSVITRVDNYTIEGAIASLRLNPGVYLIKSDTEIKKFVK